MRRHAQKGDYKPVVGCPCINMISMTIDVYKRQPPPCRLKEIYLNQTHWRMFVEEMKLIDPTYEPRAVEGVPIEHSDVTVKKGLSIQKKAMKYEFYDIVELARMSGVKPAEA